MDASLEAFTAGLAQSTENWDCVRSLFLNHVRGPFLEDFVAREVGACADDPDHVVARGVGQGSFTFINTPDFEYSLRVLTPFPRRERLVKWVGVPQMIAFRGAGTAVIRTLRVPAQCDIEQFQPAIRIADLGMREVRDGGVVVSAVRHEILDIQEVTAPVVVQTLTYRHLAPSLIWTFTPELLSLYAEQSSLDASRFRNVLRLAQAEGVSVPDDIYKLALESQSPQVVLLAIHSMVASGNPRSFAEIQRAMESEHPWLRAGASNLLDAMFSSAGSNNAD